MDANELIRQYKAGMRDFVGISLPGSNLGSADLHGANLRGSDFHLAMLMCANLGSTDLSEADLREVNLIGANLEGAKLCGARMSSAKLRDANLSEADLSGAQITQEQLDEAKSLKGVIMPDGSKHIEPKRPIPDIQELKSKFDAMGLIAALGYLEDKKIQASAVGALGDLFYRRLVSVDQLVSMGAVELLINALSGLEPSHGYTIATYLVNCFGSPAVEPLIAALGDHEGIKRAVAAYALKQIGDPRAQESLILALRDVKDDVRNDAAEALDKLGWQHTGDENEVYYHVAKKNWDKCVQIGKPAVEPLSTALKSSYAEFGFDNVKEYKLREGLVIALGKIGDPDAIESLITVLKDNDASLCKAASEALVNIGSPAVEALIPVLQDKQFTARVAAATALGLIGAPHAIKALEDAYAGDSPDGRAIVLKAMDNIKMQSKVPEVIVANKCQFCGKDVHGRKGQVATNLDDSIKVAQEMMSRKIICANCHAVFCLECGNVVGFHKGTGNTYCPKCGAQVASEQLL